jgi:hypothetical protein
VTLAPFIDPSVHGVEGKRTRIEPGTKCVVPGCLSLAQQTHHLWSKSFLRGQPVEWVCVEGETIPNTVGLCLTHHEWVTGVVGGHMAHIRWNHDLRLLFWWQYDPDQDRWSTLGALRGTALAPVRPPEAALERRLEGLCPTCGRTPKKERAPGPARKVRSWGISVPDDGETGAEVLDTYIEELGALMGFGDEPSRLLRYHVLVPVLEWVMQNRVEFLRDWQEAE